jgi:hypothetical protein
MTRIGYTVCERSGKGEGEVSGKFGGERRDECRDECGDDPIHVAASIEREWIS